MTPQSKKKLPSMAVSDTQTRISQFVVTTGTSGQSVTSTSAGATTSAYTSTTNINFSNINYSWNSVPWETLSRVESTWAEAKTGDVTSLGFKEITLQPGQTIAPIDPQYFKVDPQKTTERTRQPLPIDIMQSLKDSAEILYTEIASRNREVDDLRYRELENKLVGVTAALQRLEGKYAVGVRPPRSQPQKNEFGKLIQDFKRQFRVLTFLEEIALKPIDGGVEATFVHSSSNTSKAIEAIVSILDMLQDQYPDLYFEPRVIPKSHSTVEHRKNSQIIRMRQR